MSDPSLWNDLHEVRHAFDEFVMRCAVGEDSYRLTPNADPSAYARCFGVYCLQLSGRPIPPRVRLALADSIRTGVREVRTSYSRTPDDKAYRQLLAFSLSALASLGALAADPLADLVEEQLPSDVATELMERGCLDGKAGSGNHAMFLAVFLLHARDYLQLNVQAAIDAWVELHLARMNRFGFWGPDRGMTHLHFQNGYHQYEVFEYLGVSNPRAGDAVRAVRTLSDRLGHYAPYPGGGGCYDYDAVFVLTPNGQIADPESRMLLERTAATLLAEQREDGGFAESLYVRPRSLANAGRFAAHLASSAGRPQLFLERLRYGATLQRPAHNRIGTHWSRYSRGWDESDLWDSWFRMLALARIQAALHPAAASEWGFIDYPGIGFHPSLKKSSRGA
jgi:hypothetical protein